MLNRTIILLTLLVFYFGLMGQNTPGTPFIIGETLALNSDILEETRSLNVYLPQGYHSDSATVYNIIYLLDGSANEDFLHIVGLVQFFELQMKLPPTIVVGIANVDRKRDFTFHSDNKEYQDYMPTRGGSAAFMRFLKEELKPFIANRYKTSGRDILIGQSLGGLLATEVLLKEPRLFSDYLIISPSLWWDDESLLEKAPELLMRDLGFIRNVYVSVGSEGKVMEGDAKKLYKEILKGVFPEKNVYFKPLKKEDHATILHASIYEAFKILFPMESTK